ncbi:MAG: EscU/YscU/HrcU family type III secretion system export apparatus switch protein [Paludisphaera borealis]|uniref:EscU/YscU/HrcU family type III secretion system export apparatus switch protein n=1 Tax=Paludisphaera borealis TaxID=1387353 RepID=UPI002842A354|nr:EscU/YscU/HrcU family type III secretion system export apparatus switch protein [Paludisphaera borealis]MDR3620943.1 EscU/YscU/HrcU family type III secretion system export apparatus switch protein [Paludisphaera borealis]
MSEDRTQPASKRRRLLAREEGQVVHSPELTAAVGWLTAVVVLGVWGQDLAGVLIELARAPLVQPLASSSDPVELAGRIRGDVLRVAVPLGMILGGFLVGAAGAHQAQVRGLWAPNLIAPDVSRLWRIGRGGGLSGRFERSVWSIVKVVILASVAWWGIRSQWSALQGLSLLDFPTAARSAMSVLLGPMRVLAVLMVVVGLVDYGLRFARFESMLRTTPDEQREDQKAVEGDPRVRASRRRLVQSWRDATPELLTGATLILHGDAGLTVVLSGGPPPRRIGVRAAAQGKAGNSLRRAASQARIPSCEAPQLALRLASQPNTASARSAIADPLLVSQLRSVWPAS